MAIIRFDPFSDLDSLHNQVDDVFGQMFSGQGRQNVPTTDVYTDDDKSVIVEAHLPNFTEKEITVDVHQGVLQISAEHSEKEEKKEKRKYLLRESSNSFYRQIALPSRVDDDAVQAKFSKGVLKVTVPLKELPKPKRVSIESGKK